MRHLLDRKLSQSTINRAAFSRDMTMFILMFYFLMRESGSHTPTKN
jgi:hypothetical protein